MKYDAEIQRTREEIADTITLMNKDPELSPDTSGLITALMAIEAVIMSSVLSIANELAEMNAKSEQITTLQDALFGKEQK